MIITLAIFAIHALGCLAITFATRARTSQLSLTFRAAIAEARCIEMAIQAGRAEKRIADLVRRLDEANERIAWWERATDAAALRRALHEGRLDVAELPQHTARRRFTIMFQPMVIETLLSEAVLHDRGVATVAGEIGRDAAGRLERLIAQQLVLALHKRSPHSEIHA